MRGWVTTQQEREEEASVQDGLASDNVYQLFTANVATSTEEVHRTVTERWVSVGRQYPLKSKGRESHGVHS